jgi:hypothetical protein
MEKKELHKQLEKFCRAKYEDDQAMVLNILDMPGHA